MVAGRGGARCFLREEGGGEGRQEAGREPVMMPRGKDLDSTFIPVASRWQCRLHSDSV